MSVVKSFFYCAIGSFLLAGIGCNGGAKQAQSSQNLKDLSIALITFHDKNASWPDKLEEIKPLIGTDGPGGKIGGGKDYDALMTNPVTGAKPGYEYVKPTGSSISKTVMLY